jgi:bifunctional UDP-N-acetylglucosamine pyrophosphorylase/glucosamine-1-phosphate N-acetyltransferase
LATKSRSLGDILQEFSQHRRLMQEELQKVIVGQDTVIEPFTYIHGEVKIGQGCRIGPFAYLRDGTVLDKDVVLGVYTEVKNSTLAEGVRARHLSFIGDTTVGQNVNIGAGSITANFDGEKVNRTNIGDNCYVGSGAVLIAPLELKEGSNVGAGTVVSQESAEELGKKA